MKSFYLTDAGKVRSHNEDSVTILKNASGEHLLIVADGMGGHRAGEIASSMVVTHLGTEFSKLSSVGTMLDAAKWLQDNPEIPRGEKQSSDSLCRDDGQFGYCKGKYSSWCIPVYPLAHYGQEHAQGKNRWRHQERRNVATACFELYGICARRCGSFKCPQRKDLIRKRLRCKNEKIKQSFFVDQNSYFYIKCYFI